MSRTDKDLPWRLGGHRHRYWTSDDSHGRWARSIRRMARAKAKRDLRAGREPLPLYPVEREYFD